MLKDYLIDKEIILASGSPRRHQFFKELEIPFTVDVRPVKEEYPDYLTGNEITDFLAELKAESFKAELQDHQIVITSDTIVCNNDRAIGKPTNEKEAIAMIKSLSGITHQVITSVCFTTTKLQKTVNASTMVSFKVLTTGEINYYVEKFKPYDKAGGYAIQEWIGLIGITRIEGSYFNVVGLPTHLVYDNLLEVSRH